MKPQIVNIINFVRGVEPRFEIDLLEPVRQQLELLEKHKLKGTFLLQYDALINPDFVNLFNNRTNIEIGLWLEIVEPLCKEIGLKWRGREGFSWDWHAHVGFSVGYTRLERMAIVDEIMNKFKLVFGYYPASVGSWVIDAFTLNYLSEKYGIAASCNCKDQWGTDGYTLWGGYYSQAYYPSKTNVLCPAQTSDNQIDVPLFRMLGSDPIYQYDIGLETGKASSECQKVVTLEPVYSGADGGGGIPQWVDWFFNENFNGKCISFAYVQVGQENSFGWEEMKDGLTYQIEKIAVLSSRELLKVETLAQSGKWFKETFAKTPASSIAALSDWKNNERKSIWYNCINYRINFICEGDNFWIRDIYRFDERYTERYLNDVCSTEHLVYDNLPVMDGNRWSGNGIRAGIYPVDQNLVHLKFKAIDVSETKDSLTIRWVLHSGENVTCCCIENGIIWEFPEEQYGFAVKANVSTMTVLCTIDIDRLSLKYNEFTYYLNLDGAAFEIINEKEGIRLYVKAKQKTLKAKF